MTSKSYSPEIALNNSGYPVSYVTSTDTIFMPGEHGEQLTNILDYKKITSSDLSDLINRYYNISDSDTKGSVDNYIFSTGNTIKVTLPQVYDENRELHLFFKDSVDVSNNIKDNLRKTLSGNANINDFFSSVYSNTDLSKPILYAGNSSNLTIFIKPNADSLLNRYITNDNTLASRFIFEAKSLNNDQIEFCPYKLCELIETNFANDHSALHYNISLNVSIIKDYNSGLSTLKYDYYSNTLVIDDNASIIETANGNNYTENQLIVRLAKNSNVDYKVYFEILYGRS